VVTPARLVLLRHAETTAGPICVGRLDPGLSHAGARQARAAVERLALDADLVVASPARRARETAAAFAAEIRTESRLAERDFGAWEGRPWEEIWAEVEPAVLCDPVAYAALTPPEGETTEAVAARVGAAVEELTEAPGRTVLAVTHAGPLRLAVAHALRLDAVQTFALAADHARAAVLARYGDAWVLERLGA
jgi:alpha-ribazole phosphatase